MMRREESKAAFRYIYTIGCKSFLMGYRVQSRGRDYQGRSGSGVTCICPGLALWTPPAALWRAGARPGHGWGPGEEVRTERREAKPRLEEGWVCSNMATRTLYGLISVSLCFCANHSLDPYTVFYLIAQKQLPFKILVFFSIFFAVNQLCENTKAKNIESRW